MAWWWWREICHFTSIFPSFFPQIPWIPMESRKKVARCQTAVAGPVLRWAAPPRPCRNRPLQLGWQTTHGFHCEKRQKNGTNQWKKWTKQADKWGKTWLNSENMVFRWCLPWNMEMTCNMVLPWNAYFISVRYWNNIVRTADISCKYNIMQHVYNIITPPPK